MDLRDRHALVCGASAGIGRAAALALKRRGATVTALARSEEKLKDVGDRFVVADLDDRPALSGIVDDLVAKHGPVHVLINNTGGPKSGPLLQATDEQFTTAFGRHILASHMLVKQLLPGMREAGYGRIVNVVSISVREPIAGLGVSNTIRAAMASWSKTMAGELPPGVTINCVLPGYTDTERLAELAASMSKQSGKSEDEIRAGWIAPVPEGRLGTADEIGEAFALIVAANF